MNSPDADIPGDRLNETELAAPEQARRRVAAGTEKLQALHRLKTPVLCLDIEASGIGPHTFPIEVALAEPATGSIRSWIIRPAPEWLISGSWIAEAEAIHGLSREHVLDAGMPFEQVAEELLAAGYGAQILSDAPRFDMFWLDVLYRATGAVRTPLGLDDFMDFARACAARAGRRPDIAIVKAEAEARSRFPVTHRAGADARHNAEILRQLAGINDD